MVMLLKIVDGAECMFHIILIGLFDKVMFDEFERFQSIALSGNLIKSGIFSVSNVWLKSKLKNKT